MRVLAINDLSSFGRVSLTTVISVLSATGVQCVPVPTSLFSTHTAFEGFKKTNTTTHLNETLEHFKMLNIDFDYIYSGYLGDNSQIDSVILACKLFPKAKVLIDPVMADNNKIYKTYTAEMCKNMQNLVKYADILTPNITEAKVLLDIDVSKELTTDEVFNICKTLGEKYNKTVIITGISLENTNITTLIYNKGDVSRVDVPKINSYYPGTGDLFASVLLSQIIKGKSVEKSTKTACNFVFDSIKTTDKTTNDPIFGVNFEPLLKNLI